VSNESYSISVSNVEDLKANAMSDTIINFVFVPFEGKAIVCIKRKYAAVGIFASFK
jgi:hypothetical protein